MAAKSYTLSLPPLKGGEDRPYSQIYFGIGKMERVLRKGKKDGDKTTMESIEITRELTPAQVKSLEGRGIILTPVKEKPASEKGA